MRKDQIRTVIKTFKEKLFTEIFPGRTDVPKTLVFAKDDSTPKTNVRRMLYPASRVAVCDGVSRSSKAFEHP
jgi:type I site-specific restriction endonuclease